MNKQDHTKRDKKLVWGCILGCLGLGLMSVVVIADISHALHYDWQEIFNLSNTLLKVLVFSILFIPTSVLATGVLKRRKDTDQGKVLARIILTVGIIGLTLALVQLVFYGVLLARGLHETSNYLQTENYQLLHSLLSTS